jgi:hypothetical protein
MEKGLAHADYNKFFTESVIDGMPVERLRLTELNVPTGQLVATDPLVAPDLQPFNRKVSPGRYPVDLFIAHTPASGQRVAVAVLTFSEGLAVRYELALRGNQSTDELEDPLSYFGFPVDAGLGAFYDRETSRIYDAFLTRFYAEHPDDNIYDDFFAGLFKQNARRPDDPRDCGDWLDFHIPDSPEHNMAIFQSGYGDGVYPAYWGVDSHGMIVNLVIDFHVLLLPD